MSDQGQSEEIQNLFANNRAWANEIKRQDAGFFERLAAQQNPKYLWIGCSDSRVPANQITGLMPGEVFVHRNVANLVMHTDINCMSVVEFAIRSLKVRHVIICGHYGCAGVQAAMDEPSDGVVDHWLSGIRDLWDDHQLALASLDGDAAQRKVCELNVRQQVKSLSRTTVVKQAWRRGQAVDIHGWIYGIEDGLLRNLGSAVTSPKDLLAE
jgi:carbonic anhydrase